MPKVSVLIPIYNVERYLRQCLNSVVNQTLKDIEIICINDGSTDNSLSIIKEFADRDKRIKIIDKKNTGYGHSMNCGLDIAQGEYIGIIESDDFADLNMFETLYNTAKNTYAEIVRSNHWEQVGEYAKFTEVLSKEVYGKIFSPRIQNYNFFSNQVAVWSGIYQRNFLNENNIRFTETPGASYQDISFAFKSFSCTNKLFLIKDAFVHYRVDNPDSSVKSKQKVYCIFDEFEEIEKFLNNRDDLYYPCRYIFESMIKFQRCEFHFHRIDDVFKFEFFKKWVEEFKKDNAAGYLNKDYWEKNRWLEVQELLSDEKKYFYDQCKKVKYFRMYKNDFLLKIESFRKIYIYGAGKAAQLITLELFRRQIHIEGFIVSDMKDNPDNIAGVTVNTIENFNIDKKLDVILISIKDENQPDIFYDLISSDYKNVLLMTKDLRRALMYYYM